MALLPLASSWRAHIGKLGRSLGLCAVLSLSSAPLCPAQNAPASPAPPVPAKAVRISFLPPPLDGTISLGIYDASGKLVRVLQREAELDDFTIGNDALSTTWDGKSDAGEMLPPGKYHARGYVVGDVDVEGIGYAFNDWITDDASLRIKHVSAIAVENGILLLTVTLVPNRVLTLACNLNGEAETTGSEPRPPSTCEVKANPPAVTDPVACDDGRDGTRWVIDRVTPGAMETEVKQLSRAGELLRRLAVPAQEPQPRQIAVSKDTDTIFLLEENGPTERLRSLTLAGKGSDETHSDWKVDFSKSIVAHKDFAVENGKPVLAGGKAPLEKIAIKLRPNPLKNDARENLEVFVGCDADGSFLKTADGLPLQSISEARNLVRVALAPHGENSIDVFQDDDAVIEQFQVRKLDQMMSFDCGEIELK